MCDTVVTIGDDGVLFAKNSDRDPNEAQIMEWSAAGVHREGARQRCTWIDVEQVPHTHATMVSRPFWMWGAEMGTNSAGLTIGNEAVFTTTRVAETGLTGMDLLRLALQRATSVDEAIEVIVGLLERYPQGGGCGHEHRSFRYHSSFLIADAHGGAVLETAGDSWATETIDPGATRSISNGLTIEGFAERFARRPHQWVARARQRRAVTEADRPATIADAARLLRRHGTATGAPPRYSLVNGAMSAPCMHAGGVVAASQTTGAWIAALGPGGNRHFSTAAAAPCTATFCPVDVDVPLDLGRSPTDRYDPSAWWWRHEVVHRCTMATGGRPATTVVDRRDAEESEWFGASGSSTAADIVDAWNQAVELDRIALREVRSRALPDLRPWFVRHYWGVRGRRSAIDPASELDDGWRVGLDHRPNRRSDPASL